MEKDDQNGGRDKTGQSDRPILEWVKMGRNGLKWVKMGRNGSRFSQSDISIKKERSCFLLAKRDKETHNYGGGETFI